MESRNLISRPVALLTGGVIAAAVAAYVYSRVRPVEKHSNDDSEHSDAEEEERLKELREFNDWFVDDDSEPPRSAVTPGRDQSLDDGLTALGMQSNVMYLPNASPGEIRIGEDTHVAAENPDVDDVIRVERVSQEEEMRRYFSGMDSGQRMVKGQHHRKNGSSARE
ncbi:hypothetical protein Pmar_PMAR018610 [Perkinsus marinus ATCC 50983]|uniref:Transmembrane protein n=1 Tax=Perkinsus marinus (strain ATCC 50983 / TXsc) TaxID=423536 RepID=C5L0A7_PERM5|nr:hypothetical protein Pmar_PMAR018610 [Perkinsus marinus ATCC 50983]EER09965.1 hypothetical protein Pmar_PMAR018610 [Perkinsus marinus ATCC 50983]|eukprot:XP_002778170.1 hypothetical protein Pmar_PMAR018610 [Perkinsus marinus ATCC 50983]